MVRKLLRLALLNLLTGFSLTLALPTLVRADEGKEQQRQYLIKYRSTDMPGRLEVARMTMQELHARSQDPAIDKIEIDPRRYRLTSTPTQQLTHQPGDQSPHRSALYSAHYGPSLIQANQLSGFGAPRTVCIIDSGYDSTHPNLPGKGRVTGATRSGAGRWDEPGDAHGTHVAGTIAAVNTQGRNDLPKGIYSGVGLNLHIVRIFADDQLWVYGSDLIAAVEACAAAGANIISMSLGGEQASRIERETFETVFDAGVLSIAAAGNDGSYSCSYPACYSTVVSVAAVDYKKQLASFSQRNKRIELAAPGVKIWSTILDGETAPWSGTSTATPHVSGAAALLWSLHPQCANQDIRKALGDSAEDLGAPGRDSGYGYGLIQVSNADQLLARSGCELNDQ